jgi:multidrug resistance efflux pump
MTPDLNCQTSIEEDPDYRDFIDSISVSREEMSALITVPEVQSVEQARAYVRKSKTASHRAHGGWLKSEAERLAAQLRHALAAISLAMVDLRHGRNHRQT